MARVDSIEDLWLGPSIRAARVSLGLRQVDLAALTGLPTSHLSGIERGTITPTIPTLLKIGMALNRPLEYFLQEEAQEPRSFGMVIQESSTGGRAATKFAEFVEEKTNGEVRLHIYHHSALGTATEQVKALQGGAIHLYVDEPLSLEPIAPLCGVVFQPFFFRDRDHYHRFLHSSIFAEHILQPLQDNGIRLLNPASNWLCGSYEVLFSDIPIFHPEDLRNTKF